MDDSAAMAVNMKNPGRTLPLFAPANEPRRRVRDKAGEIQRRVNQADVRVRLRKVTQLAVR